MKTAEEFVIDEGKYFKKNGIYIFQSISSLSSFIEKFQMENKIEMSIPKNEHEHNDLMMRYSILENQLIDVIAETNNNKLMDIFLDFQDVRNKLNSMNLDDLIKLLVKEEQR